MNPVKVSNYASVCIQTMQFLLRGMTRACCSESCPANIPLVFILHKLQCVSKPCATNTLFSHFSCEFFTTDDVFRKRLFVSITNLEQAGILIDTFSGLLTKCSQNTGNICKQAHTQSDT